MNTPLATTVEVAKASPDVQLPTRGSPGAAAWDLYAYLISDTGRNNNFLIPAFSTKAVPTGLFVRAPIPLFVLSRSGLALKSIFVANAPGLIDPDYRGVITVALYNGSRENYYVQHGDRVGQIWAPTALLSFLEVSSITPDTERGAAGFGSTGR